MNKTIALSAPARIHLGLFDLANATSRTFGGAGFALQYPATIVRADKSEHVSVQGIGLSDGAAAIVRRRLTDFLKMMTLAPVSVTVLSHPPEHVGLGSRTTLVLAALAASCIMHEIAVDGEALQGASGRGGASGIGSAGFFSGGFIVDAGHKGERAWLPSAQHAATTAPTVVTRVDAPPGWRVSLYLPRGKHLSGVDEVEFFERSTPLPRADVVQQIAIAYHELAPAAIENDLNAFGAAVEAMSRIGLKAREIRNQDAAVQTTIDSLREVAPCVGMSSMGPLVFAITDGPMEKRPRLRQDVKHLGTSTIANSGFRIVQ